MDLELLSSDAIEKLKCSKCSNYLSYFPIRVCADNLNICGRCSIPGDKPSVENMAFQTLSQFMRFPCRYKDLGCEEERQPKNIPSHEQECPFRFVTCPVSKINGCDWSGGRSHILDHCRNAHRDLFIEGNINLDLSQANESYWLLEHDGLLLIFHSEFDFEKKILNFEMSTSEFETNSKSYSCTLKVQNDETTAAADFISTTHDEVAPHQLNLESFPNQVTVQITVGEVIVDPNEYLDLEMLAILKCFNCQNYALPPIYQCVTNSGALCSACKGLHQPTCPTCCQNTSIRNISLDKMASHLNYPCKNHTNGCKFISKPEQIKAHHTVCELGPQTCPFAQFQTCLWKGILRELLSHLQGNHKLYSNSSVISRKLRRDKMTCDLIKFSGHLFRLVCLHTQDKYFWSVQSMENCDDFKYEIEIVDPARAGRRLLMRQQCGHLTAKVDIFKIGNLFCYFFADQVRDFVVDQLVVFKVHIFV